MIELIGTSRRVSDDPDSALASEGYYRWFVKGLRQPDDRHLAERTVADAIAGVEEDTSSHFRGEDTLSFSSHHVLTDIHPTILAVNNAVKDLNKTFKSKS